jgi:hypothetical protein
MTDVKVDVNVCTNVSCFLSLLPIRSTNEAMTKRGDPHSCFVFETFWVQISTRRPDVITKM